MMKPDVDESSDKSTFPSSASQPWIPDASLSWLGLWNTSPLVAEMWASFATDIGSRGELREIQWKGPRAGERGSVLMNVGYADVSTSIGDEAGNDGFPKGLLHSLPMFSRERLQLQGIFTALLPWKAPGLMGAIGIPPEQPGARRLLFNFEMPAPYIAMGPHQLTKVEHERMHLDRFTTDFLMAHGELPFRGRIEPRQPPLPDFLICGNGHARGVDCIQFAETGQREAHYSLVATRQAILSEPRDRFMHLAGAIIYIWFGQNGFTTKAYRASTERPAIHRLVEDLANFAFDPQRMVVDGNELPPEKHPLLGAHDMTEGGEFYGVPLAGDPNTSFYRATGFELGMGFSFVDDAKACWARFGTHLREHDKPGFDDVIVTFGGPDRHGFGYISEEALLMEMVDNQAPVERPQYIRRVFLYAWETGAILELVWPVKPSGSITPELAVVASARRPTSIQLQPFTTGPVEIGGDRPSLFLGAIVT